MKLTALMVAAAAAIMFAPSAHAREHYYHHSHHAARHIYARSHYRIYARSHSGRGMHAAVGWTSREFAYSSRSSYRGRDRGRPAAWCGWEMRRLVGADPGPSYNLARNWAHWGRPGRAGIGAVVVWAHHVGKIVGQERGQWVIESGNDGHALRTRPRSIAGAIAIRWG
jgi:hypothetical protein